MKGFGIFVVLMKYSIILGEMVAIPPLPCNTATTELEVMTMTNPSATEAEISTTWTTP